MCIEYVDCSSCINRYYCMEVFGRFLTEFRRNGIKDFSFKIKSCTRYSHDSERDKHDEEHIESLKAHSNF